MGISFPELEQRVTDFMARYCGPDVELSLAFIAEMAFALGAEPGIELTPIQPEDPFLQGAGLAQQAAPSDK